MVTKAELDLSEAGLIRGQVLPIHERGGLASSNTNL